MLWESGSRRRRARSSARHDSLLGDQIHKQIADEVGDNSDDEARAGVSAGMSHSPVSPEI
jgi:hypothetical protein